MNIIYKQLYSCGYIKYGYSGNYESRSKSYRTHTGDLILKTIKFPNKDKVDELAIHEYLIRFLGLQPVEGCKEIFKDPGGLNLIDGDLTLETFYRHLHTLDYIPPGSGKIAGLLKKRIQSLHILFESKDLDEHTINAMSNLICSWDGNVEQDNIFVKARSDYQYRNRIIRSDLTIQDLLDVWFRWDWEILKKKGL